MQTDAEFNVIHSQSLPALGQTVGQPLFVEGIQCLAHGQGTAGGLFGMIRCSLRRTEHRENAVTQELDDTALVLVDDAVHHPQVFIKHGYHLQGRQPLADGGVVLQVAEQHGHHHLFTAQIDFLFLGQHGTGHVFTQVTAEQVTQGLTFFQFIGHLVEIFAQQTEFILPPHVHPHIQVTLSHCSGALNQAPQRFPNTAGHQPGHQRDNQERHHKDHPGGHQHPVFHHAEPLGFDVHTHQTNSLAFGGTQGRIGGQGIAKFIVVWDVFHRRAGEALQHDGRVFRGIVLARLPLQLALGVIHEEIQLSGHIGRAQDVDGVDVLIPLRHGLELGMYFLVKRSERRCSQIIGRHAICIDGGRQTG